MTLETRAVPGLPGYSVTRDGRVWSDAKTMRGRSNSVRQRSGKWLKPRLATMGYYTVNIRREGRLFRLYLHRAVAAAWVPNPSPDVFDQVNHLNGIKTDNRPENLEWCDQAHNNKHAYQTGLKVASRRALTDAQADEVRSSRAAGVPFKQLVSRYGLSRGALAQIVTGRTYRAKEPTNV